MICRSSLPFPAIGGSITTNQPDLAATGTRCTVRAPSSATRTPSAREPVLAAALATHEPTCAAPSPGQMAAWTASAAAETSQNSLLRQVSANCLRQPRRRRRVPALPERITNIFIPRRPCRGSGPGTHQERFGTGRGRRGRHAATADCACRLVFKSAHLWPCYALSCRSQQMLIYAGAGWLLRRLRASCGVFRRKEDSGTDFHSRQEIFRA